MSSAGVLVLALLAATPPVVRNGRGTEVSAPERPGLSGAAANQSSPGAARRPGSTAASPTRMCKPGDDARGYVNPLAAAAVVPRRIDQGVDYGGSGTLKAVGAARITHVATADTGWPGAFIEYQLLSGPEAGCYVYNAEGITPAPGLRVGETERAGQTVASIDPQSPSGIELGWGAGDGAKSYAAETGEWSAAHEAQDIPSASGLYFSALIAALGGPPGKVEG